MKFFGQDKYGPVVVKHLQTKGPHTVREMAEIYGIEVCLINKAVRRMMCRGLVEETGEYRGKSIHRAKVYRFTNVEEPEILEPMMNSYERNNALAATDRIIGSLRGSYIPGLFDPFRVLRAQVGGMA